MRLCNRAQNVHNTGISIHNTSGYKGVSSHKCSKKQKWAARIHKNNKCIRIGQFEDIIDAAKAYDRKAEELFGEFAVVNFPSYKTNKEMQKMKGTFKIIISPNGQDIKIDVGDVIGASCTTLSKVFTDLGNKTEVERKNEYYMETEDNILVRG